MDQRRDQRYRVRFPSSFSVARVAGGDGFVVDLSLRGCRISSKVPVASWTTLVLDLCLPDRRRPLEIAQAGVRWAEAGEFGVEFLVILPEAQQRLLHFVSTL